MSDNQSPRTPDPRLPQTSPAERPARSFRQLDLNLLVALEALLTERSVTKAGQRVGVTQSAMSGSLARLRGFFGDQLLIRVGRQYQLTPKATELLAPVLEILTRIDDTLSSRTAFDPFTSSRRFVIAASDYVSIVFLNSVIQKLGHQYPNLQFHIQPLAADSRQVRPGGADLVIEPKGFIAEQPCRVLFSDSWVVVVDAANVEVGDVLDADLMARLPFVSYSLGPSGRSLGESQLSAMGVDITSDVLVENFLTACMLVRGTNRAAIVQRRLAESMMDVACIRIVELPIALPPIQEAAYWNSVNDDDPGHLWLREVVAEVATAF